MRGNKGTKNKRVFWLWLGFEKGKDNWRNGLWRLRLARESNQVLKPGSRMMVNKAFLLSVPTNHRDWEKGGNIKRYVWGTRLVIAQTNRSGVRRVNKNMRGETHGASGCITFVVFWFYFGCRVSSMFVDKRWDPVRFGCRPSCLNGFYWLSKEL